MEDCLCIFKGLPSREHFLSPNDCRCTGRGVWSSTDRDGGNTLLT